MSWRYCAFRTRYVFSGYDEEVWDIREAYYDEDGKLTMVSAIGSHPSGDSRLELLNDVQRMAYDVEKHPTLTPKDVPGYEYGEGEVSIDE